MAELTLRPDGDVQLVNIAITGAATASEAIDEPVDSHDGDTTRIDRDSNTADASATLELSGLPSDFKQIETLTARAAVVTSGVQADDTLTLNAQLLAANGGALSDEIVVATSSSTGVAYSVAEVAFTSLVKAGRNDWDNARVKLRWDYTAVGTDDLFDLRLSAFEADGTYTPRDVGPSVSAFTRLPAVRTVRGHSVSTVPSPTSDVDGLSVWWEAVTVLSASSTATIGRVVGTRYGRAESSHTTSSQPSRLVAVSSVATVRRLAPTVTFRRVHTEQSTARIAAEDDDVLLLLSQLDH